MKNVDSGEVAHDELPHLDLHCLQTELFSFLVFLGLSLPQMLKHPKLI